MVPVIAPSHVEALAALRARVSGSCQRDVSKVFAAWLLQEPEQRADFALIAAQAAKREGVDQDFQTISILGFAADAGLLSDPQLAALKKGLGRLAGRSPVVNGVPMGFCADAVGILGVATGTAVVADAEVTGQVVEWAARFLETSYKRDGTEDWQRCLFAAADRKLGYPLGLPIPNSATTADVRIALLSSGLVEASDAQSQQDEAFTLDLAVQDLPEDFICEQAALRLKALEWVSNARVSTSTEEELSTLGSSETEALRSGPDVHVFWGPYWTGGVLSFRNEGTEAAKNVRLQCSAEGGWRPIVCPEVVASISPGATVRVVDEGRDTPGQGHCIADFVHSLPSKEHTMTITFEDRLGEKRMRDFRVVAAGRHAATESLAVTFYAGTLRKSGIPRVLKNLVDRMRAFRDAEEMSKILNPPSANADRSQVAESDPALRAQEQRGSRKGHGGKKPVRRNAKYEEIDRALREISAARPKSHEEVFQFLDDRKVAIPSRKPFKVAGGWLKGFRQNHPAASAWLSQAWGRLELPAFARGPKK